jgi:hypothetical protein
MKINYIYNLKLIIQYFVRIFCLTLLPMHLTSYVTGAAHAQSGIQTKATIIENVSSTQEPAPLKKQLLNEAAAALSDDNEPQKKNELMQLIQQIRSIEFPSDESKPEIQNTENQTQKSELKTQNIKSETQNSERKAQNTELTTQNLNQSITEQTMQILSTMIAEPQKFKDPARMAEILYQDGKLTEAATLYKEASRLINPDNAALAGNRAWFLFQTANCLRNSDMPQAAKLYGQIIKEYPDSPWTEMARTQNNIILWFLQDKPDKLISQNSQKIKL